VLGCQQACNASYPHKRAITHSRGQHNAPRSLYALILWAPNQQLPLCCALHACSPSAAAAPAGPCPQRRWGGRGRPPSPPDRGQQEAEVVAASCCPRSGGESGLPRPPHLRCTQHLRPAAPTQHQHELHKATRAEEIEQGCKPGAGHLRGRGGAHWAEQARPTRGVWMGGLGVVVEVEAA